ncbi:2-polyprenyl-6-methoxyphenol hydroxylase [Burkholderia gladioli BSR3]|uniref:2-polyprenyl-6-methoxyphenol hydroxylase n=2 Tax=Burkholderia gladioli TaxID=28095 RepID=F2LCC0_BURGS|nr:bifunctional 3-(3-hydroxy-phenyl)propionate/3-hydroxycinnamic acid hydroxylase [Burkholderia gladioli]AEA60172.1 2-polyprenyl-6-methoxyphenol hydroxylase [Burkholderia gladioli BSR3]MBW5287262.1 bifunctional 3-(3-hydroxy-phenyl)propionate/3-hydroxycinnamic acid hydroxylase [Burkholderia gladioli]
MNKTSVVIVGAGPNGAAMANMLGLYGIETVIVERNPDIVEFPRAVGMDDESLRLFQTAGLADELSRDMIQNVPLRMFKANGECFADIRPSVREFGWWRRNIFMQQLAEKTLREGLARYPHVTLRTGEEVMSVEQDADGVRLQVRHRDGRDYTLEADYVVAADGGRSPMREWLGVPLEGTTHPMKWVVVDVKNAGVEQPCTALNCDPKRPNVCIYLPFNYRRWEFLVYPHEDVEDIAKPESIRQLIGPYVNDIDAVEIVRARTYTHHSRLAGRFLVGRIALIGDAAHLTPPWVGQGLNAGLRDVGNLAWKLAGVVKGSLSPKVLDSYESERRDHAKAMIDLADTFGAMLMPTNRAVAFLRDSFFSLARFAPGLRNYVLQMRFKPMPSYTKGVVLPGTSRALGRMLPQPDVETVDGQRRKLDDVLGPWFSIIGWRADPQAAMSEATRSYWRLLGVRFVQVNRSRSGTGRDARLGSRHDTVCVEDIDNALADWFEANPDGFALIRPDRYVAAQTNAAGLDDMAQRFRAFAPESIHEEVTDVC